MLTVISMKEENVSHYSRYNWEMSMFTSESRTPLVPQ